MHLDLDDLTSIKPAAASFAAQEERLDILWNNAGGGFPAGSVTKQGYEAHVGSNCVAPLLFTQELLLQLKAAARTAPKISVRVIRTGSSQIQMSAPKGGVDFARVEKPTTAVEMSDYAAAKAGNWFLTVEGAKRWGKDGIISVCQNPGNLNTTIFEAFGRFLHAIFRVLFLYPVEYGACTILYAGFSSDVNEGTNGAYIWPFGKIKLPPRADVVKAVSGDKATEFWDWCERSWKKHV